MRCFLTSTNILFLPPTIVRDERAQKRVLSVPKSLIKLREEWKVAESNNTNSNDSDSSSSEVEAGRIEEQRLQQKARQQELKNRLVEERAKRKVLAADI
jgi:hypothetical protein